MSKPDEMHGGSISASADQDQLSDPDRTGDWLIQRMVFLANRGLIEIAVTVTVDGFLISGQLSSGRRYFQETSILLRESLLAELAPIYDSIRDEVYPEPNLEVEPDESDLAPTFIHLRDAKYFHPGGQPIPANTGVWWRGRISQLSGFSVGLLGIA